MARKTRKEIFKSYGIEYRKTETGTEHIKTPFGNWIPFLLVDGNSKVGKPVKTWSIMHGNETFTEDSFESETIKSVFRETGCKSVNGSCFGHCDGCYCDSGNYTRYPSVYSGMLFKLILVKTFPEWTENAITAQIEACNLKQIRIHASGDFYSKEYCDMWSRIARRFEGLTLFWTYTKNPDAIASFEDVNNLSIVPSVTPYGFNFGTTHEIRILYNKLVADGYKVHICACGTEYEKHCSECETGCKYVGIKADYVLFIKHSVKDYTFKINDSEDDYNWIINIIRNQDN